MSVLRVDLLHGASASTWARDVLGFDPDPVQARVLDSRARRGHLRCCRQWGKSTVTAVRSLHRAWFRPGSLVLVTAPAERQSNEWLRKVEHFAARCGVDPRGDGQNAVSLLLPNSSRLVGLPMRHQTTRAFGGAAALLVDEAAFYDDLVYKSMRAFVATSGGDIWLMSSAGPRSGFFFDSSEFGRSTARWERHIVPATSCPRLSAEFLAEERRELGERMFEREYMCQFIDEGPGSAFGGGLDSLLDAEVERLCV